MSVFRLLFLRKCGRVAQVGQTAEAVGERGEEQAAEGGREADAAEGRSESSRHGFLNSKAGENSEKGKSRMFEGCDRHNPWPRPRVGSVSACRARVIRLSLSLCTRSSSPP